jgi:hypothetical protein
MKAFSLFVPSLFSSAPILVPHLFFSPVVGAQATSTPPAANSNTLSAPDSAAAKAAERKKRFDEAEKKLENSDPRPQEQSRNPPSNSLHVSPNDLSLSPILVNMLVGNTQHFSLFDLAGHKLTSQADWTVSDSSVAELSVINGVPTLVSKQTGTVHVRARIDERSAEASVNVITPADMKPGTILWQAPSIPGFKPIQIVQAVPSSGTRPAPPPDSGRP